jgi:hypothetical protein
MNLRNTLLSLLTLTGTVTSPVLAGYQYQGVSLMDGSDFGSNSQVAGDIINSLNELGVPVIDGGVENLPQCEPNENGSYTLGFYVPSRNIMAICTDHGNQDLILETLVHEAVHVIQDARAGIDNGQLGEGNSDYLSKLADGLDTNKANIIVNLYDKEDWNVELEAFYFESQPQVVANELRSWAF